MALPTSEVMYDGLHLKISKSQRAKNQALTSWHPTSILSVASCCRFVEEYLAPYKCDHNFLAGPHRKSSVL